MTEAAPISSFEIFVWQTRDGRWAARVDSWRSNDYGSPKAACEAALAHVALRQPTRQPQGSPDQGRQPQGSPYQGQIPFVKRRRFG